jgi:sec-independent protein translocase protein TatC
MAFPEDQKGAEAPTADEPSAAESKNGEAAVSDTPAADASDGTGSYEEYDDGYPYEDPPPPAAAVATVPEATPAPVAAGGDGSTPPPSPPSASDDDDDEGMLRMSFLEHLEELRSRIIKALLGIGIAFVLSLTFTNELWRVVAGPAVDALKSLGYPNPGLSQIKPMEVFNVVWIKLPILCAIFMASPWVLYQVWAFIAPGLYRKERRWAAPFVICSAGLFIAGGLFAYFVAFRFGLTFLLGLGRDNYITPMVSVTEYFDLFVNVTLGVGLVFELPVLVFFLTLLRIVTPGFLVRNSRYAILAIFALAAVVTPTPDIFNLMIFATPMCVLFYVGVFASYLLVLQRENRKFPWKKILYVLAVVIFLIAGVVYLAITKYGYHPVPYWPFLLR